MKKKILFLFMLLLFSISFTKCEKDKGGYCNSVYNIRVGAICNDGTHSDSTGEGTCSEHGGVYYWLCK